MTRTACTILVLIVLLSACSIGTDKTVIITEVRPDVRLDMTTITEPFTPFSIKITTTENHCDVSTLRSEQNFLKNQITISIDGILGPEACPSDLEPLEKHHNFDLEAGSYAFKVTVTEDLVSDGVLTYNGLKYTLEMETNEGVDLGRSEMYAVPYQIIWGTLTDPGEFQETQALFEDKMAPITSSPDLPEGYYGFFTIQNSSSITIHTDPPSEPTHSFVRRLNSSTKTLEETIDALRSQLPGTASLEIHTWRGESF